MDAVHGAVVAVRAAEEPGAVEERHAAVARGAGAPDGRADDAAALGRRRGRVGPDGRSREDEDRQVRMRRADGPEERLVRGGEVLRRRRIVVVVEDERREAAERGDELRHLRLAAGAAGEAEVHLLRVERAADHRRVGVARTRRAAALRDRGAVEADASEAVRLVREGVRRVSITVEQREYDGESHNVTAEIPGRRDEFITLTAHYDTTSLSHGAYDNMSGCAGLLGVMDALRGEKLNYGLRFVFCGSEERGLLGSKAYVRDHQDALEKTALNINLDMIGTLMGKFIAVVSAEEKLAHYLAYTGAELGFPLETRTGVYSSDSTPFADNGVPALSMARLAGGSIAPIHCRYDQQDVLSMEQMEKDIAFITAFTRRMADAAVCPVSREIPESVRKELDEYLFRKRKKA